jgi:hypothetical protein
MKATVKHYLREKRINSFMKSCNYEQILSNNDREQAKNMVEYISTKRKESELESKPIEWEAICKYIGYPFLNSFNSKGVMNDHFCRVLNELKILSIFGKHTFHCFNNK